MKKVKNKRDNNELNSNIEENNIEIEEYEEVEELEVVEMIEDSETELIEGVEGIEVTEEEIYSEQPQKRDKVMNALIAVFTTFILMFSTFYALKLNSALKSATILNNTTTQKNIETEETQKESETETEREYTTMHTTPSLYDDKYNYETEETTELVTEDDEKETKEQDEEETDLEKVINAVPLSQIDTGYTPLDEMVKGELAKAPAKKYDRLKAVYTSIVRNFSDIGATSNYDEMFDMFGELEYASLFDSCITYDAYKALTTRRVTSKGYAAAFVVLSRALGIETYYVEGKSNKLGTDHAWVIAKIGGKEYIFDPYLEDKYKDNSNITYSYFGKQMYEIPGEYIYYDKSGDMASFSSFATVSSMTLNVDFGEITGACKWIPSLDRVASVNIIDSYVSCDLGESITIDANVPGIEVNEWKVALLDEVTGTENIIATSTTVGSSHSYTWTPGVAGNYSLVVSAMDAAGRCCKVVVEARIINDREVSGLNVTYKLQDTENESYLVEAKAQNGIGDVQYDFKVYKKLETGEYELVDKSWIEWSSPSSIIINVPNGTPVGTEVKVLASAADDAGNKVSQEINITTKGNN